MRTKFIRHYSVVAVLFVLLVAIGAMVYQQSSRVAENSPATLPAQVVVTQAVVVPQGVQIAWLKSQPGSHPISAYMVERSRGDGVFGSIAHVESAFSEYVDADGRPGDSYRIFAEDSGQPVGRSPASEKVTAAAPRPGSVVVMASTSAATQVLGAASDKANSLQDLITQAFTDIDGGLSNHNFSAAQRHLNDLHNYQRQALSLWPQFDIAQKNLLAKTCSDQSEVFEANLHRLPEDDQFAGMLVLAGCSIMQGEAE